MCPESLSTGANTREDGATAELLLEQVYEASGFVINPNSMRLCLLHNGLARGSLT